jgi:hypothetical protein
MKTEDVTRRQLLARKNYGRRQMSEYLDNLSMALSCRVEPADLLTLEETDSFFRRYTQFFSLAADDKISAFRNVWSSEKRGELDLKLYCFKNKIADQKVILFSRGFDYSGALKVGLHQALERTLELIELDKDSVALMDTEMNNGLMLDTCEEVEESDGQTYELVVWGDKWKPAIDEC